MRQYGHPDCRATLRDLLAAKTRQDIPNEWLKEGTVAVRYGRPGSYKTVVSLALGNILSYGTEFNGMPAAQGLVVYLTWEGTKNLTGQRRDAWFRYYRRTMPSIDTFKSIHFLDSDLDAGNYIDLNLM